MSFLHLIYVGDFERDGPIAQFTRTPGDPTFKPVVRTPIDLNIVDRLVSALINPCEATGAFPASWHIWREDGYLACDRYALSVDEILFLKRLTGQTDCRLFERAFEVSVDDLIPSRQVTHVGEVPSSPTFTP